MIKQSTPAQIPLSPKRLRGSTLTNRFPKSEYNKAATAILFHCKERAQEEWVPFDFGDIVSICGTTEYIDDSAFMVYLSFILDAMVSFGWLKRRGATTDDPFYKYEVTDDFITLMIKPGEWKTRF